MNNEKLVCMKHKYAVIRVPVSDAQQLIEQSKDKIDKFTYTSKGAWKAYVRKQR